MRVDPLSHSTTHLTGTVCVIIVEGEMTSVQAHVHIRLCIYLYFVALTSLC